jgi:glycerol-3-phosphate dehydrogenase
LVLLPPHERSTVPASRLDVIVIGGGVNGCGTFRDLALRGRRVMLLEKDDFGAGTSGASSGMIHGGLRYMLSDPQLVHDTCVDSGRIHGIARHLTFRIPFIVPVAGKGMRSRLLLSGMDWAFEAYDRFAPMKGGRPHARLTVEEALRLEPGLSPDISGAVTFDEWGIDVFRLCIANVISGEEAGGKALNHARVEGIEHVQGSEREESFFRVRTRHLLGNIVDTYEARCVVNAAGPWGPSVASLAGAGYRLRPSRGVHVVFDRRISNYAVASRAVDDRTVYLEPWQNLTIAGCTDDDYYGDPDDAPVTHDDVSYLVEGIRTVFPSVVRHRAISTWVGVRPTLHDYGPVEEDLSRAHRILDHAQDGLPGLLSIAGGKLAAYRAMSEEAADAAERFLGRLTPSTTATAPLPGAREELDPTSCSSHYGVDRTVIARLVFRHGSRSRDILASMQREPFRRALVCRCEPVTDAEIRYACRHEKALTLEDVMHRTRMGTGPCGGLGCAMRAASILAEELDRDPGQAIAEARAFLEARYRARRPALRGDQARMEAVARDLLSGRA